MLKLNSDEYQKMGNNYISNYYVKKVNATINISMHKVFLEQYINNTSYLIL